MPHPSARRLPAPHHLFPYGPLRYGRCQQFARLLAPFSLIARAAILAVAPSLARLARPCFHFLRRDELKPARVALKELQDHIFAPHDRRQPPPLLLARG